MIGKITNNLKNDQEIKIIKGDSPVTPYDADDKIDIGSYYNNEDSSIKKYLKTVGIDAGFGAVGGLLLPGFAITSLNDKLGISKNENVKFLEKLLIPTATLLAGVPLGIAGGILAGTFGLVTGLSIDKLIDKYDGCKQIK
jgi:hypothetical protein